MANLKPSGPDKTANASANKVIPYVHNPHFTGREKFLKTLREKLCGQEAKPHKHRVALYGMGGIGKTQVAIQYVYSYRDFYDRIYWIRAVDRTSLLQGYEDINKKAKVLVAPDATPLQIADAVLS